MRNASPVPLGTSWRTISHDLKWALLLKIGVDLFGKIVHDDEDAIDGWRQCSQAPSRESAVRPPAGAAWE